MRCLALAVLLAMIPFAWSFPAQVPVDGKAMRLKRELSGTQPSKQTIFDTIYEANKNAVQHPGEYFVTNLDIARSTSRSAAECSNSICTWPKGLDGNVYVPYTKTTDYGQYDNIIFRTVFKEFADATCIRFIPRTTENDYITFKPSSGCWSLIGRAGKQQFISLDKGRCMVTGVVAHELMHTLGFNHEHVRLDRDTYVAVQWTNILNDYVDYFQMTDTNNMKYTSYDYGSILHFSKTAYSVDGVSQTLIPIPDSNVPIGQTFAMSDADIRKINLLYECTQNLGSNIGTTTKVTVSRPNLISAQAITASSTTTTITVPTTTSTTTETSTLPRTTITTTSPTTTTKETTTTPRTTFTASANSTGCGGTLTAASGDIISPNYPQQYQPSTSCLWTIISTTKVNITFLHFEVEGGQGCMFDFLTFDDMAPIPAYSPKYCGTVPPYTSVSFQGSVQVIFVSDRTVQMTGFRLHYSTDQFSGSQTGTISNVTMPRQTPISAQTINVPSIISTTTEANTFPRTTITTTTKETTTTPRTTTRANSAGCGGTLTAASGDIISPNYPQQYQPSTSCLWTIISTTKVNITFLHFEVEGSQGCMFDFLTFDDMARIPAYSPKYCGTVPPYTSVSFQGSVQVIFVSDRTVQMTGFRLHYSTE